MLLFIIRVKRELKRVYRNGCRYNERLNAETGGSIISFFLFFFFSKRGHEDERMAEGAKVGIKREKRERD